MMTVTEVATVHTEDRVRVGWAPRFTHELPGELTVRNDQPLCLDVAVTALPAARFDWYYNGRLLKEGDDIVTRCLEPPV
jgi:hypothetical protein